MEQSNSPPNKQETTVIDESKGEKETAIAQIEEWGNWKTPQISPANENLQINFGLRQTRKRAARQESQSQTNYGLANFFSTKRKETEETESPSSTRVKTTFLGPNKIPFSAIFDAKNELNFITQEIALKAELKISPYTSKSTDAFSKPIGQIENLEVTTSNEEKNYRDFLVFESFNHIIDEENISILTFSKESIPPQIERKSKGKDPEEDELKVEDSEAIKRIKMQLTKMRRNLDMAIEDPEKWLALELSGMNKVDKVESQQKKFKMDLKLPEENSSGIAEDYFNLFQEEAWYISDTDKDSLNEELKDNIINHWQRENLKNWKRKVP
ncbi:hypothetical protein O181_084487 [Austropuccinia psidii MF-1]|uniref:Uncharacterized protein n=1 Tax=Austropuccinia psidii MF-1 TaxID=1389203 RepID=A0A9Q3FWD0_9BASI|nr:hypothetical protein [Austropuccinia psidii MF-1]